MESSVWRNLIIDEHLGERCLTKGREFTGYCKRKGQGSGGTEGQTLRRVPPLR